MEGSAPRGPAQTSLDPSKIVNGHPDPGPMAQVPTGGADGGPAGPAAPGPAATAQAIPQTPPQAPPPVAEYQAPAESIILTELQEMKDSVRKVTAQNRMMGMALFCIGLAAIYVLTTKIKAKLPEGAQVPAPEVPTV